MTAPNRKKEKFCVSSNMCTCNQYENQFPPRIITWIKGINLSVILISVWPHELKSFSYVAIKLRESMNKTESPTVIMSANIQRNDAFKSRNKYCWDGNKFNTFIIAAIADQNEANWASRTCFRSQAQMPESWQGDKLRFVVRKLIKFLIQTQGRDMQVYFRYCKLLGSFLTTQRNKFVCTRHQRFVLHK